MDQHQEHYEWRLQSDWYSPTRLHDSPVSYDFPGDRFIPNRSLMDLDQATGILTNKTKTDKRPDSKRKSNIQYQKKLENLTLDVEGRPFQMMAFRGSPKTSRRSQRLLDEMRLNDLEIPNYKPSRQFPKSESRILDAPDIIDDYYLNIMDWGKTNVISIALGHRLYMWNAENFQTDLVSEAIDGSDYPSSVSWSEDAKTLAAGYRCSNIHLYDAETLHLVRILYGHSHHKRVVSLSWNGRILTSGSYDGCIINHDVRARNSTVCRVNAHKAEVCGLKWSSSGNLLASGGNDNVLYIWDALKMDTMCYLYKFNDHKSAVKALAWCPYEYNVLASGGGTKDNYLKIWNIQRGTCVKSVDTKAQVCGLQWNRHHKEILSGHGFGVEHQNQICLWRYPSMSKIGESEEHRSRVLHLSQSPDGLTAVTAMADETLRFWEVFGSAQDDSLRMSHLESLLSLKTSPIR